MKNKWKRNPFFYTTFILAVMILFFIIFGIGMFYYMFAIPEPKGLSLASWPDTFTDNFSLWIEYENNNVRVEEIGIRYLDEYRLWIQILDEAGQEIFSHNKPSVYPKSYNMAELVSLSESQYEHGFTVFVDQFDAEDTTLNYIVGFPYSIGKHMLYYNGENIARLSPLVKGVVRITVCMFIFLGFLYAFWLSRKLEGMIRSIQKIMQQTYEPRKEKGVFGEVYASLNKMDREIQNSIRIQEKTDRTRKEWITNITHDLKTPLSPIKGYAELLLDSAVTERQTVQQYAAIILKNVDHTEKLINDLKLTYQLESGAFPIQFQRVNVNRYLKEVIIDIVNDPSFSERDIVFKSGAAEVYMNIDTDLFRRVIQNLVINALVHNPQDTRVTISVTRKNNTLWISIRDNGTGISEKEQTDLFTRYYRGNNTKEKTEGSGLGLAIAKQIITLHGGDIVVKSKLGVGTEFLILFP